MLVSHSFYYNSAILKKLDTFLKACDLFLVDVLCCPKLVVGDIETLTDRN